MIFELTITISDICNLNCDFCPHSYDDFNKKNRTMMSIKTATMIKKRLDEISFSGTLSISGNGEPTLNKDFREIVKILTKDVSYDTILYTNGKNFMLYNDVMKYFHLILYDYYKRLDDYSDLSKIRELNLKNIKIRTIENRNWWQSKNYSNRGGVLESNDLYEYKIPENCKKWEKITISAIGDYSLCCNDWTDKKGDELNIFEYSITDYMKSDFLHKHIQDIESERFELEPCKSCLIATGIKKKKKEKLS